ncbi:MAG: thioredoxin family protein [archaeon]
MVFKPYVGFSMTSAFNPRSVGSVMIALAVMVLLFPAVQAQPHDVTLYLFWGDGCPHCAAEKVFLNEISEKYPTLTIKDYELYHNESNREFLQELSEAFGHTPQGIPVTFIDSTVIEGFDSADRLGKAIEERIANCVEDGCPDPLDILDDPSLGEVNNESIVDIPFIGAIDAAQISLPALTVILGAADSFNPCAFFVLFFLLSMLIYARSRIRMLIIGGTFVFFSAFIYFLFMSAWLNFFLIAGSIAIITLIAGIVAIFIGVINVKDFFFYKKGISLTISDTAKPKLFDRMRGLLKADSLGHMFLGAVVLAITANTYELLCTAGFPLVYTRVLTLHGLPTLSYYLYLALYNLVYIIPLSIIVGIFTVTLGARRLSQWQGQVLKLISGFMMLFLGVVLVIDPGMLQNVIASALLIGGAIVVSLAIVGIKSLYDKRHGISHDDFQKKGNEEGSEKGTDANKDEEADSKRTDAIQDEGDADDP